MNAFYSILFAVVGKLFTSLLTANLQQNLVGIDGTAVQNRRTLLRNTREEGSGSGEDWTSLFRNTTELKKSVKEYSGYVAVDLLFEILKTVVVYITGWMTISHEST